MNLDEKYDVETPVLGRIPKGTPREEVIAHLKEAARQLRRRDPLMIAHANNGHIGGDFSIADILVTLVLHELNLDPKDPLNPDRDRLVLSKGHTAGALYIAMALAGYFPVEDLMTFMDPQSKLNGHPNRLYIDGVEANTGPLGHGFPIAVGSALAAKLDGSDRRTVVLLGDGEMQEGSNWEAMMSAAQFGLGNLVAILDRNRLQQGAPTEETVGLDPVDEKVRAFGFHVVEIDAHDYGQILDALQAGPQGDRPTLIIANSHKGYPISFMQDSAAWHHKVPNDEEIRGILSELEEIK